MVQQLLVTGTRTFIGATWKIGDKAAARFAEELYRALLGQHPGEPTTVGEAVRRARCALFDRSSGFRRPDLGGIRAVRQPVELRPRGTRHLTGPGGTGRTAQAASKPWSVMPSAWLNRARMFSSAITWVSSISPARPSAASSSATCASVTVVGCAVIASA